MVDKSKKNILRRIIDSLLILGSAFALFLLAIVVIVPSFIGGTRYIIVSDSMNPKISRGDIVITVPPNEPEVGDIITYLHDGSVVTHRISRIEQAMIYTQGDANTAEDFVAITMEDILGVVIYKIPFLGNLILK